jgi:hypothetical protein
MNREANMAKGQVRSNREIRKPKKSAAAKGAAGSVASVSSVFASPGKSAAKPKKR